MWCVVGFRDLVCLSIILSDFLVVCLTVLTNWLLKAFAFSLFVMACLFWNVIMVFGWDVVLLLFSEWMVFQRV